MWESAEGNNDGMNEKRVIDMAMHGTCAASWVRTARVFTPVLGMKSGAKGNVKRTWSGL